MNQKVEDLYQPGELEDLLDNADCNAEKDWDINFVTDIRSRYEEYGSEMFLEDGAA